MNITKIQNEVKNIQSLFLTKNYKSIIVQSKNAIKKYPTYSIFYNLLGLALNNLGEFDKAIVILNKGYKINSKDKAILNNLANAYKYTCNYKNAELFYKKALELDKNYFNAYLNYGNLKRELNFFDKANEQYLKALNINKNIPMINYALAMSYQSLGNFEKSDFHAKETLKLDPKFTKADLLISRSKKYKNGDNHFDEMLNKLKNIQLNDTQKIELYFAVGKAYEDLGNINMSIEHIQKGNKIKNSLIKYDINTEKKTFESIKNTYLKINKSDLPNLVDNNSKKIIFILGMPRSGTTLVEQIISAHPDVYGSGELPYLNKIIREELMTNKELSEDKIISFLQKKKN